jgi:hypothetical protein
MDRTEPQERGMEPFQLDAEAWAGTQFRAAELGDKRRTDRLVRLAVQIAMQPSGSFPKQTETWDDLRAAYRLFDCPEVTFQAIASPHWNLTKQTHGKRHLIIDDTTEFDLGPRRKVSGLGPVGTGVGQGFLLHSGLMVSTEDDRIHGLAGQLIHYRKPVAKGEKRMTRLARADRESQIWSTLVTQIGTPPAGTTWVHVADRGADDFEFYYHCQQMRTDWVVRAKSLNRIIITPEGREQPLKEYLDTLPQAGTFTIDLRARPNQKARTAQLVVSFGAFTMPPPKHTSPELKQAQPIPIPMWVVYVREVEPPQGVDPIDWVLETSLPVRNLAEAMVIVGYYEKRWLIEEWHKCLKTGLQVEDRQLKTSDRLEAMIGLMSVEAVRLLQLRGEARTAPDRPAEHVVPPKYVAVLRAVRNVKVSVQLTVGKFFRELAKLGGFLGRRRDGDPGWITIWRGWETLSHMIRAVNAYYPT